MATDFFTNTPVTFTHPQRSPWCSPPHRDPNRILRRKHSPSAVLQSWRGPHQNSCKRKRNTSTGDNLLWSTYLWHKLKEEKEKLSSSWKWPFEVIKTLESHHGAHALAGWRQSSIQEQITALPSYFKLAWPTDWYRNPKNEAHRQWQQRQDHRMITYTREVCFRKSTGQTNTNIRTESN